MSIGPNTAAFASVDEVRAWNERELQEAIDMIARLKANIMGDDQGARYERRSLGTRSAQLKERLKELRQQRKAINEA